MKPGLSLVQHPPKGEFDAIVIGSGIGGLACASLLAREGGQRVLVLERHYRIGGYTQVFTRPRFEWDVGVHYVGSMTKGEPLRALFDKLSEGKLQWAPLPDVYDQIEVAGRRVELCRGRAQLIDSLASHFPEKREALGQYLQLCTTVARKAQLELLNRGTGAAVARIAGLKLKPSTPEWARRNTRETLVGLGFDAEQIAVLTGQYGNYGSAPARSSFASHAAVVDHYLNGGFYPVGGSSAFAETIAPAIEAAGGHLATGAEVASIEVEGGGRASGVRLTDGRVFRAPLIVSDAGASNTFRRLLPEASRPPDVLSALSEAAPSSGYLCLYVGLDRTDGELGLTGTNLWLHPRVSAEDAIVAFEADYERVPFPMLYVSFPSAKDPTWRERYPGRSTIEVVTTARYEWFERWADTRWHHRGPGYDALKAGFQQRMLSALLERLPQLKGHVEHVELSTPLSAAHFAGHPRGELYGIESTPQRYLVPLRAKTHVEGLFFTGADLATPGVAGAAFAGALTAAAILGPQRLWGWVPLDSTFGRAFA